MNPKPRRRWWQFRLRTLLVAVLLVSIPLAWVGYSLNWIRQRRAAVQNPELKLVIPTHNYPDAPGGLWLFGEQGQHAFIRCPDYWTNEQVNRIRRLFPETRILNEDSP